MNKEKPPEQKSIVDIISTNQFKPIPIQDNSYRGMIDYNHRQAIKEMTPKLERSKEILKLRGIPDHIIAGLAGALYQESKLDSSTRQQGGLGYGLPQYTIGSQRYKNLIRSAKQQGKSPDDFDFQLNHLADEILSKDTSTISDSWLGKKNQEAFLNSKTADEAQQIFTNKFLRPGKPDMQRRSYFTGYINHLINSNENATE